MSMFSHEAHVRLAFIHIVKYGREVARENLCNQIKEAAKRVGYHDKFHYTITCASVELLALNGVGSDLLEFAAFKAKYPQMLDNFKSILLSYYSEALLFSDSARRVFVAPDLQDFVN